ncbi:MAG: DMT family transporter [Candidatus Paracaedibacteraceae bacterium]|nr:DMT family transporter [Candidatus Paracaedibacteraceae bacterium]
MQTVLNKLNLYTTDNAFLKWFVSPGYKQGVFWVLMITVVSATGDVLMKTLGSRLHVTEISFFRFFFSLISVLPIMLLKSNVSLFKTKQLSMHMWRGIIGAIALGLCCYSVNIMHMSENTTIMFTQPLFFLPLAYFFLKERVDASRWIATLIGFFGILIIMQPGTDTFRCEAFVPMASAFCFAIISMLAKKMIKDEHSLTLLFYFGLVTTIVALPVMIPFWQTPMLSELPLLLMLGVCANLIQVCIFRAFSSTDASSLSPIFYTEIGISTIFGFIFFGQIPTIFVAIGAALIIGSTFAISVIETRKEKKAA